MQIFKQISMKLLNLTQILKVDVYLSLTAVRFSSICKAHPCILNEEGVSESSVRNKDRPVYYFEDGLRKVYPFYYKFETFCKRRWMKRNIVDAFCSEYALYPREEIVNRISNGFVKVNGEVVNTNYILKSSDLLSSTSHRHELAVLACPIKILYENKDILVVDKPPSIPVHPCGLYYNNTVLSILANDYKRSNLYINYRLDRLTSGVLLLSKSSEKAREIHEEMHLRNIKKEYVCRVEGNFPNGKIICNKPIKQFYNRIGVCLVDPGGKISLTEFKKLSYNGKSSVVLCKPYTGRTHQIRVHLQYLGHPIINDPVYNSFVFGPCKGKKGITGKSVNQLIDDLLEEHSSEWKLKKDPVTETENSKENEKNFLYFSIFKEYYHMDNKLSYPTKDCSKVVKDENCYFCKTHSQDPQQSSLGMFLHALKYESENWKFKSDLPVWASADWNVV